VEDVVGGVPVAVQVGAPLATLRDTKGYQVPVYLVGESRVDGQAQVGNLAVGGVEYVEDVVGGVSVAVQVGAPLAKLRDKEGYQVSVYLEGVTTVQAQVGSLAPGSVEYVEDVVVGVPVAVQVGAPLVTLINPEDYQVPVYFQAASKYGGRVDGQAQVGRLARSGVQYVEDFVSGVPVAVQVGAPLATLRDTKGYQVPVYFQGARGIIIAVYGDGQAQVGSLAGGGVGYVEDVVGGVPVAVQVGAPLATLRDKEGYQVPVYYLGGEGGQTLVGPSDLGTGRTW